MFGEFVWIDTIQLEKITVENTDTDTKKKVTPGAYIIQILWIIHARKRTRSISIVFEPSVYSLIICVAVGRTRGCK